MNSNQWEIIHDSAFERVRRFRVPGGWLYQVELDMAHEHDGEGEAPTRTTGWSNTVFVPERLS